MTQHADPFWTCESALVAGRAFVTTYHRLPTQLDTQGAVGLPHATTLARLFGSFTAFKVLLPTPVPLPPARQRMCPTCRKPFTPAHRGLYYCDPCKAHPAWQEAEAGAWMNGQDAWSAF